MEQIQIEFSKPDNYNQVHTIVEQDKIYGGEHDSRVEVILNGKSYIYTFNWTDAGTIGYAQMQGKQAIYCRMTNVSIDWSDIKDYEYPFLHCNGNIDHNNGTMTLYIWADYREIKEKSRFNQIECM